jgi:hypothetical protein
VLGLIGWWRQAWLSLARSSRHRPQAGEAQLVNAPTLLIILSAYHLLMHFSKFHATLVPDLCCMVDTLNSRVHTHRLTSRLSDTTPRSSWWLSCPCLCPGVGCWVSQSSRGPARRVPDRTRCAELPRGAWDPRIR